MGRPAIASVAVWFALLASLTWAGATRAADLAIGLAADVTTMDPHFANITANRAVHLHVFDRLVTFDANRKMQLGLVESYRNVDDLTWEFKLRRGVKFHNGSEFTAEDVVWSLDRPATLINSPSPFTLYTKEIVEKTIVDKYTLRLKTGAPYALLLSDLSTILIISKNVTQGLSTDDFNSGKGMVGTGPYKFVEFKRGDRINLVRNEAYWGDRSEWDKVSLRILTTPSARVAALMAGDVQVIEGVPPVDIANIRKRADLVLATTLSDRLIFLNLDVGRDNSPFITDKAGKPLSVNPLKDLRVRQAISKAINRPAIVERVMEGNAVAAGQYVPLSFWGAVPSLKPETPDPEGAKKLLAQAGYPDGFAVTLHSPNDRYINDAQILQTVAQMMNRIGLQSKVESMPANIFFGRQTKLDFSINLSGWGGAIGLPYTYFKGLTATYNPATGYGTSNPGRYSNAKVDALVAQAFTTLDLVKQEKLWQEATSLAMSELALIPLHHQFNTWAARNTIVVVPRTDAMTLAYQIFSKK